MSAIVPRTETVEALRLSLHDRRIGVLTHYSGGKNILTFDPEYAALPYVKGETGLALNLAKQKRWRVINLETFKTWAQRVGVPWPAVRVHLLDAISKARDSWPQLLQELPMREAHKEILKEHWSSLSADFRL